MSFLRPALRQSLSRNREVLAGGAVALLGGWIAAQGGWLMLPAGGAMVVLGTLWAWTALRRLRFQRAAGAPGMVEIDEGQIGYLGPAFGGYVALPDLVEIRLLAVRGRRLWRLRQADGQALLVPVDAVGADRLFDAFASLPGLDAAALVAALDASPAADETRVLWRRPGTRSGLSHHPQAGERPAPHRGDP
jgi:hypothetical protein